MGGNILILHENQMNLPATSCWEIHQEEGDLVVLTDVEHSVERLSISDFLKLTDAIQPKVLEIAITIACKIGRAARCGKRPGAIFMLAIPSGFLRIPNSLSPIRFKVTTKIVGGSQIPISTMPLSSWPSSTGPLSFAATASFKLQELF